MNSFADIIAAISTPPGKGGVAIIRISGVGALDLAEKIFLPASKKKLGEYPPRTQVYGYVLTEDGKRLDDGMACRFSAGASFTGEETVEISSHGGVLISSAVLERAFAAGARQAEAGEFTRRAFINGRISLGDAEAIGLLLEAKSSEQIALASRDSRDALHNSLRTAEDILVGLLSSVYARIDYPDEDLGDLTDGEVLERLKDCDARLGALLATYKTGKAIADGIKTVICGKPNAGKSTVYNMILGEDAAIVTDIKGTTTDVLERSVALGRVVLRLSDTAGIRAEEAAGVIERIGIERSRAAISDAELIIAVFDLSEDFSDEDRMVIAALEGTRAEKIALLNKSDLPKKMSCEDVIRKNFGTVITVSSEFKEQSLAELTAAVNGAFVDERIKCGESAVISSARQRALLVSAREFITMATDALAHGASADMVSSDIERALRVLSESDGREVSEAVTSDIFSKFCVGK